MIRASLSEMSGFALKISPSYVENSGEEIVTDGRMDVDRRTEIRSYNNYSIQKMKQ